MLKPKKHLIILFLSLLQINASLSENLSQHHQSLEDTGTKSYSEHGGRRNAVLLKRQTGSFGFQHNSLPTTGNYYPSSNFGSGSGRYDPVRGNGLGSSPNSLRGDRDYYPSSYPSSGRSSGGSSGIIGGGYYGNYRDDYRDRGDYRGGDRDRQPYYDDYRYNGYQSARDREAAAAQTQEFVMRNGQQRHAEYQKRIGQSGQEYYDPFYFIGLRNKQAGLDAGLPPSSSSGGGLGGFPSSFPPPPSSPSSSSSSSSASLGNALISPTSATSSSGPNGPNSNSNQPSSPSALASHPLRNRRNSQRHRHHNDDEFYNNELSGDKYELMSAPKNAYPTNMMMMQQRNSHRDHQHHHRWANLDQQFLTREQLVRHPDSRVHYPPHNRIDRYGSSISAASGQPWSVRIGTQLKVNDDGRSPHPHRFYVRDEINPGRNRSRYPGPIYRKK
ncbi:uncharacterized protein LOC110851893 [Folsomia candida]|uniref:Uncharacterized protein n=1 Tax=Folsomia candida TaxID=158441 RepID=A0A226E388_FOLCA|nr:uncharacterized protein LOC110851893 [Folsomia candida]XP_021955517.1 uncharacterized protein LOC110851893 [Folsomia candida]OXA51738.1 hypothetical protein Fcan01_13172 [Folsomia candida]